jgi:hypothetical protein
VGEGLLSRLCLARAVLLAAVLLAEKELSPPPPAPVGASEKDAKLVQKLVQLKPFIAVFPQEYMGQLASFGPI